MIRVIYSEYLKIRTTKVWWLLGLFALVFTALALLINGLESHSTLSTRPLSEVPENIPAEHRTEFEQQHAQAVAVAQSKATLLRVAAAMYTSGQFFGVLLVMLLGAIVITNEFQHQTATTTFLTTPRRTTVIIGKLITAMLFAVCFWLVTTAIDLVTGAIYLNWEGRDAVIGEWVVIRAILLNLAAYAIWAVLGIGLGVLIRSQIGAVVTATLLYMLSFPVTFIAFNLIHTYVIKKDWVLTAQVIVPAVASQIMTSTGKFFEQAPPQWVGAVVLVGYGLVFGVIGTLITRKRDIS